MTAMDAMKFRPSKGRFEYSPLGPGQIRLLKLDPAGTPSYIPCSIDRYDGDTLFAPAPALVDGDTLLRPSDHNPRHERQAQCPGGYSALSYTWGDPTPVADISPNGRSIGVAQNLFDFLSMAALCLQDGTRPMNDHFHGETYYCIHALCINQGHPNEKPDQVQRMWQIYKNAKLVIIWLGPQDESTVEAFRVLIMVGLQVLPLAQPTGKFQRRRQEYEETLARRRFVCGSFHPQ